MAQILVLGAGVTGLTTAMLLARDGHDVTVLERDPASAPTGSEAAWTSWARDGVAQFRQLHVMLPRWRAVMAAELPEVLDALRAAGGRAANALHARPVAQTDGWQPGDERFDVLTARRPVLEAAVAATAQASAGVTVHRGVRVTGLLTVDSGVVPRVVGVRTGTGEFTADLVVDAGGRRSVVDRWMVEAGGQPPREERADSGFAYYSRHYRAADGRLPDGRDAWLTHQDSVCAIMLPADNGTWAVGLTVASRDRELRALRHVAVWEAAVRGYPAARHWIDAEPITDVAVMGGIDDRRREFVVDGVPVVTGLVAVGDAWACTNPSLGRGLSLGAMHAVVLRDVLAGVGVVDPASLVLRFAAETDARVGPYLEATLSFDRHRLAEMEAAAVGSVYRPDDPGWARTCALWAGARQDPVLARTLATIGSVLATPAEALADPVLVERLRPHLGRPHLAPGPDRAELIATVRASARRAA